MEQSGRPTVFWTRRRRWWAVVVVVVVAALATAGQWLPGWGVRYGLVRALHEMGWPRVSVLSADLSLFDGAVVVRRVQAGPGDQLARMLGIDGLDLRFRWKPLFSRRVSVERLDLSGVEVEIQRQGDHLVVNGLPLAVGGGDGGGSPLSWTYDVTALSLSGSRIRFTDGPVVADIEVERLDIQDVRNWEPERPVRYVLQGKVNGAALHVEGTATPFADHPGFAARLRLNGFDLTAVAPLVRDVGGGVVAGQLDLDLTVSGGDGAPLAAAGTAALAGGRWSDDGTKVAADHLALSLDSLRWEGNKLALAGTLDGRAVRVEDGGVVSSADVARLVAEDGNWDGKGRKLSWRGTLHADHHQVSAPDIHIEHAALDWSGTGRFDFAAQATSFVHAEGRVALAGVSLTVGDMGLSAKTVTAEGVFEHARPAGVLPPLAGHMAVEAAGLRVWSPGRDWLTAERLTARELKLAPGTSAGVERLQAETLAVLAQTGKEAFRPRLEARRAELDHAVLHADGAASAAALTVEGARARITRTADGIVGLSGGDGDDGATSLPKLALGKVRVVDGRVDFRDRTLAEPVSLRLDGIDATVEKLDTTRPERESPFTAAARLGVAQLTAQGQARPFAVTPTGTVNATVRALELPPLSSYVAEALGVHVQTGQLDAEVALTARQGKLDGTLHLALAQLFIAPPDPGAPLAKAADMPVETVLDLLRDSENRIRLTIPVAGDLSNPDFDTSDAVGQAVGGALQTAMFTTLKVAFPLAGLISLVIDDAESRRLALEPLPFAPGVATLDTDDQQRLQAVAGLMKDHASVQLTLCGVAAQAADGAALAERRRQEETGVMAKLQRLVGQSQTPPVQLSERDRLLRLAEARAQAAKAFLAESAGIDPGRLFTCRPRIETEEQAVPRVDLVL